MIHLGIFTFGACLLGFGVSLYCQANLGADPMSTFALGLGNYVPLQVAQAILVISYGMLIATYMIKRENLGLGSFLYPMISAFATNIGFHIVPVCENVCLRYMMLCSGILCMAVSIAITAKTRVGYNPYDGLAFSLMERWHTNYRNVRWLIDGSFLCVGILLGAIFDTGTIIVLCIMGPCASLFMKKIDRCLYKFDKEGGNL